MVFYNVGAMAWKDSVGSGLAWGAYMLLLMFGTAALARHVPFVQWLNNLSPELYFFLPLILAGLLFGIASTARDYWRRRKTHSGE
jgi:hypothetical protein